MPLTAHGRATLGPAAPDYLTERLEQVKRLHLNLSVGEFFIPNRPDIQVYAETNEDLPPAVVSMRIGRLMGEQLRWVDLTPDEADALGDHLKGMAELVRREVAAAAERQMEVAE